MKVFVASDFHGDTSSFRKAASKIDEVYADVVVVCGDITIFGSLDEAKDSLYPLKKLGMPVFFVPGNCDPPSLISMDFGKIRCIHGVCKVYENLIFIGVGGGLVGPYQYPFVLTEKEVMNLLDEGFKEISVKDLINRRFVLVSHMPPKNTKVDLSYSGSHIGSLSIRQFIYEKKPSILFCGHVHESRGIDKIGKTIIVNPGAFKDGSYATVDINDKIEVKLHWLY